MLARLQNTYKHTTKNTDISNKLASLAGPTTQDLERQIEEQDKELERLQNHLEALQARYLKKIVEKLRNKKYLVRRQYLRLRREMVLTFGQNRVNNFLDDFQIEILRQ